MGGKPKDTSTLMQFTRVHEFKSRLAEDDNSALVPVEEPADEGVRMAQIRVCVCLSSNRQIIPVPEMDQGNSYSEESREERFWLRKIVSFFRHNRRYVVEDL